MSSYPPGGDYDERLLDSAPKATRAEKQEGYNVNLLASETSETPMNARVATVDGHASLEAGNPPTKETYVSPHSVPWYRQKKWRIIMFVAAILVIGAVVGGAVGGTVASNNKGSKPSGGPVTLTLTTSSQAGSATGAPLDSPTPTTTTNQGPPISSLPPPVGTSTGAGVVSSVGGGLNLAFPTPTQGGTPNGGGPGVAPVVVWSE